MDVAISTLPDDQLVALCKNLRNGHVLKIKQAYALNGKLPIRHRDQLIAILEEKLEDEMIPKVTTSYHHVVSSKNINR